MRTLLLIACTLLVAGVPSAWAAGDDDQDLIAGAAALRQDGEEPAAAPAGQTPESQPERVLPKDDDLNAAEHEARIDVALAQARLELLLARRALRQNRMIDAARRATRLLALLDELPDRYDTEVYQLQAEGILSRAARLGVDLEAIARETNEQTPPPIIDDYLDKQARAAEQIGRRYEGADTRDIDTNADAQTLRRRALRRQTPDDGGYRPAKELIDVDAVLQRDNQRGYYEDALRQAYQADEARRLMAADEARIAPDGDVAYPDDWPRKVARRKDYEGGQIARSDSWVDQDGREWFMAVYDIHDLIYVPPDFQIPGGISLAEDIRNTLDRAALRYRSQIFGGYAEDLAMGIPLLRYFGGVDDYAFRGPKYSLERQEQIIAMIQAFLDQRHPEARIISLPPINP